MTEMQVAPIGISTPDQQTIHGSHWRPRGPVVGVIQLFHGLGEHHRRYERFARLAVAQSLAVVAHDHRGHGAHSEMLGYFSDDNGWQLLIDDGLRVNDMIRERHAGIPIVLLGHSMGSYIAQHFSIRHSERLTALVLSASTWPPRVKLIPGQILARAEAWRIGIRGKSGLLDRLGFGAFNKRFAPARTDFDWLSRDDAEVDAYVRDPLCGGPYSCGLWLDLMGGLRTIATNQALQQIRHDLPILLTGGADDPVGGGNGIAELAMHYAQTGHSRLSVKIYRKGRHEMFNEINRDEFSDDVLEWIEKQLQKQLPANNNIG